jgi:hypothetical protein
MALSTRQIEDIADDAVNLRDALIRKGVDEELAGEWVSAAMDAIVITVTDQTEYAEPDAAILTTFDLKDARHDPFRGLPYKPNALADAAGEPPRAEDNPELVAQWERLTHQNAPGQQPWPAGYRSSIPAAEQPRWGNFNPDWWPSLQGSVTEALRAGPEPGHDMRLVAVSPSMVTTWSAKDIQDAARQWVLNRVPGADPVSAERAGQTPDGTPVYLVTYKRADAGS